MQQVLLVEDSMMFGRLAKKRLEKVFDVPVFWAQSLAETEKLLEQANGNFSVALLDFNLPDAPHGEVIDKVVGQGISSIVFTTNMSNEVRSRIWDKRVADYIIKEDPNSLDYVVSTIRQFELNQNTLVLIVDQSETNRTYLSELLYVRKFRVLNASNPETAQEILEQYPEIKLVIADFEASGFDGCNFTQKIRENHTLEDLAIVGFTPISDRLKGVAYLKSGASDCFGTDPFIVEEFYTKVSRALEVVNLHSLLRDKTAR
ncbi:response regulator [Desulforhopalus sp. 52FAK]